jgi:hypothetical protein
VPVVPVASTDDRRIFFTGHKCWREVRTIPEGAPVAVLSLDCEFKSFVVRGIFRRFEEMSLDRVGELSVCSVYNTRYPDVRWDFSGGRGDT